mgnify:CR=1 FL=1
MPDNHALLAPSSSERWINCPPSAKENAVQQDTSSSYAQQGTDAHTLCEYKVKKALGHRVRDPTEDLTYFDEERPDDPAYADSYFINANSATKPGVVDADCQPILDTSELYSGIYGRASINFYAFNTNGNRGIACGLNNLQKLRDGEPLGGKSRAEDDFADDDDDDFLS